MEGGDMGRKKTHLRIPSLEKVCGKTDLIMHFPHLVPALLIAYLLQIFLHASWSTFNNKLQGSLNDKIQSLKKQQVSQLDSDMVARLE